MVFSEELSFAYTTESIPAPNLLQTLTGESIPVQIYFKEKVSRKSVVHEKVHTPVKVQSVRVPSSSVDLDITGSPLKAGFDPNEVFDDSIDDLNVVSRKSKSPVYSGLPVKCARTLLSKINVNPTLSSTNSTNYILCSLEDRSNLLYLGNKIEEGNLTQIYKTTWEGPVSYKSLSGALESFTKSYSALSGGRNRTQVRSRAEYLLTGEEGESFLVLECSWERSGSFLESPPPDALSKLKVCLVPGDGRFACDKQNSDIEQLEGLVSGLAGEGLVWSGRDEDLSLEDEILEVLEASSKIKPSLGAQEEEPENVLSLQSRQDMDITDMLWAVLSRSESFSELSDLLTLVFQTVLSEEIRPFIYSGNLSGMAGMLRDVVRSGRIPDLSGSKPLSLLIEMGIEKLKRDSSHFLLSADLASKESLDPFLSGETLAESVDLIKRLHLVVELAFACQTCVNLPSSSLKTLVHSALLQLRKHETLNKVQLEFPIQTSDVKNQLETGKPGFWQIKLENEDVSSVAQLQIEKPLEIHPSPTRSILEDELEPEYFIIYHTLIKQDV